MPLLHWLLLVVLQYLVNPVEVRAHHRLLTLYLPAISGWLGMREHLHQRPPVDAVFLARCSLRQLAG
jgi:hypothetical protein